MVQVLTLALFCLGTEQSCKLNNVENCITIRYDVIDILHLGGSLKSSAQNETPEFWIGESNISHPWMGYSDRWLSQLKKETRDSNMVGKEDKGFLDRWLIPVTVTVGAGSIIYAIYSVRGS